MTFHLEGYKYRSFPRPFLFYTSTFYCVSYFQLHTDKLFRPPYNVLGPPYIVSIRCRLLLVYIIILADSRPTTVAK